MTGYQSKKTAALDEEGMYLVHQTASYADNLGKSIVALGKQTVKDIDQLKAQPAQEPVADALIRQYITALVSNKPDEAANATKAMVDYVYTTPPAAQPAQEPVEDVVLYHDDGTRIVRIAAQRPWVDLTEDQIKTIEEKALTKQWAIRMTIAQLKECNA